MLHESKHWGFRNILLVPRLLKCHYLLHLMHTVLSATAALTSSILSFSIPEGEFKLKNFVPSSYYLPLLYSVYENIFDTSEKDGKKKSFFLSVWSSFFSHFSWCPCWISYLLDILRPVLQTLYFSLSQPSVYYTLITFRNVYSLSKII